MLLAAAIDQSTHLAGVVAATINNPDAVAPPEISDRVMKIMSWVKWGALVAILGSLIFGAGALAVGKISNNYGAGSVGSKALIGGVVGAIALAASFPIFNALS